jgi:mono/diheme cytochrome c family protein
VTDDRTGRELEPTGPGDLGPGRTGRELTPREPSEASVERFSAGEGAHTIGLTEERAAQIVRQSGNARNIAFLAVLVVVLFVPLYWFYDLGVPAVANTSRLENEAEFQYVTDVGRGYAIYLANCAQCHGRNGEGGIGPPLNDQNKLYNALTPTGQPGTGHLNPNYLRNVLTVGGRYVCGDPKSLMPVWADVNGGPLNYRQIEELIAFLTASKDLTFQYQPEHAEPGQTLPPPVSVSGWRDPNYKPPANQPTPPACWRAPEGVLGGGGGGAAASPSPITNPGTASNPRPIKVVETASLQITDEAGTKLLAIPVKKGETVQFQVENTAGFDHNFYIGSAQDLESNNTANLEGVPNFTSGTKEFTITFDEDAQLQFACTVPGHYGPMHGDIQYAP